MKLNKHHIVLLKKARELIRSGEERYICYSLDETIDCDYDYKNVGSIKNRIEKLLFPYAVLEAWLEDQGVKVGARPNYKKLMREYRIRWINHMIKTGEL